MKTLVDTCIWSLVLRRNAPDLKHMRELEALIKEFRVQMIGPVRQEILSGIYSKDKFNTFIYN